MMSQQNNQFLSLSTRLIYASLTGLLCMSVFFVSSSYTFKTVFNTFSGATTPYMQWLLLPYASLYILFVLAFLQCQSKKELVTLCKQTCFVLSITAICTVLLPSQFSMQNAGIISDLVGGISFFQFDHISGHFPSIYTALCFLIWQSFRTQSNGKTQWLVAIWFPLMIVSNILVNQLHFLDLLFALLSSALALHFFSASKLASTKKQISIQHNIVAMAYLLPAVSLLLLGMLMQGWFAFLVYPGLSLSLVSLAYFRADANFTQKSSGQFPWWTQVLFLPYLMCIKVYWRIRANRSRAWVRINSGIIIGRTLSSQEWPSVSELGTTTVLDLSPEIADKNFPDNVEYIYMPLLANVPPSNEDLEKVCKVIGNSYLEGTIFVHCKLGKDRCTTVLTAYLAAQNHDLIQSMEIVQRFKPNFDLPAYYLKSLLQFTSPMKENHLLEQEASSSHRALT